MKKSYYPEIGKEYGYINKIRTVCLFFKVIDIVKRTVEIDWIDKPEVYAKVLAVGDFENQDKLELFELIEIEHPKEKLLLKLKYG